MVDEERDREPYEPPRAEELDREDARLDTAACLPLSPPPRAPESRPSR
jgi:hypothetical protein